MPITLPKGVRNVEVYLSALQQKVCPQCPYAIWGEDEQFFICTLPEGKQCGIKLHFQEVVRIVESMPEAPLEHFRIQLRSQVCSQCEKFKIGTCPLTGVGECTLQTYLEQVVEMIREVRENGSVQAA